jgi:hypothetical protein
MLKNCTATADKVCRTCSSCAAGFYVQAACAGYQDTACAGKNIRIPTIASSERLISNLNACDSVLNVRLR